MGAKLVIRGRNWTSKIRSKATPKVSDSDAKQKLRGKTIDNYGWQKWKMDTRGQNTWMWNQAYILTLWFSPKKGSGFSPLLILKLFCHLQGQSLVSANSDQFSSVLSCNWLFAIPWIAACQASLSITNSQSLLKLMFIKLVIPSNHLIFCHPLLLPPSISPSIRVFSKC